MGWFSSNNNNSIDDDKALVRACCVVGFLCSAWNLFGDLYFMDFFTVHMREETFGMIREEKKSGYLFQFNPRNQWLVFLVQAGGWMYPIWAMTTAIPLYIGFQAEENETSGAISWKKCRATVPCALLVYGLCLVGGAFHSAFAFITVLPNVVHYPPNSNNDGGGWSDLVGTEQFPLFLEMAQTRIIQHIFAGALPGLVALQISSVWIALLVHYRSQYHQFPKWFNLFNPVTTTIWVQALGAILPNPVGFYLVGCLGTWGPLFLNLGTTYCLWNANATNAYSIRETASRFSWEEKRRLVGPAKTTEDK